jgi:hypothetical protein
LVDDVAAAGLGWVVAAAGAFFAVVAAFGGAVAAGVEVGGVCAMAIAGRRIRSTRIWLKYTFQEFSHVFFGMPMAAKRFKKV